MNEPEILKPLKTWSYLSGRRRKPSEYEIVSTNLHATTDNPDAPFELDPNFPLAQWFKTYRNASPIAHPDWNAFRDPDEIVYRTYNLLQDGQENYVLGLFDQFSERGHDAMLDPAWANTLAQLYTPSRYLCHAMQMMSAYLTQIAPASTISNCATYQAADCLRWLTHTSYRTRELSLTFPQSGFGRDERNTWENDAAWQGIRKLVETAMITYDWAEAFVVLNLMLKPAMEAVLLRGLGDAARHNGDTLLGLLSDAQLADALRHRRWTLALMKMMLEQPANRETLRRWISKWQGATDSAINNYCQYLPDAPDTAAKARAELLDFHGIAGL